MESNTVNSENENFNTLFIFRHHHTLKSGVPMPLTQRPVVLTMNLDRNLVVSHFAPTAEHRVKLWDYAKKNPLPEYLEKSMIYQPEQGFLLLTRVTPEKVSGWKILTSSTWADTRKALRDSMIQNAIKDHMWPKRVLKIGRHWSFDSEIVTEDNGLESTIHRCASFGFLGLIVMIGMVVFIARKVRSPKQEQVFYTQTQPVLAPVQQQSVPITHVSSRERELEHLSRQAQIEARKLRQQLANQTQLTQKLQTEAAQKQISDAALAQKQHELAVAQREKEELEAKLAEAEKNTHIVQNITYNIQDSAISGDITNKIN